MLKNYNNKYNQLDDAFHELKHQYDITQYELKCVKKILLELCTVMAPSKQDYVQELLNKHDKVYKTLHEPNGKLPLANIRFHHQLTPDLGNVYVWNNL